MQTLEIDLLLEASSGGAARHVLDLFQQLDSRSWPVKLFVSPLRIDDISRPQIESIPKEKVFYLPMRRSPHWTDLQAFVTLREYLRKSSVRHLIHAHSTKAGIVGAALSRYAHGSVFTPHAYRGMDPTLGAWKKASLHTVEKALSRQFDVIIGVSQEECEYATKLGIPSSRVRWIPNGVDSSIIASIAQKSRMSKQDAPVIGFVGRMAHQKNPVLFLDTFSQILRTVTKATALIVGDGPLLETMKSYARAKGIGERIVWAGGISAIEQLGKMDVLVHTSRYESLPYILMEAMAASVPIVSIRNDGSSSLFDSSVPAYLVASNSATELADRVVYFLSQRAVSASLTEVAFKVVEKLSKSAMVDRIIEEYEALDRSECRSWKHSKLESPTALTQP